MHQMRGIAVTESRRNRAEVDGVFARLFVLAQIPSCGSVNFGGTNSCLRAGDGDKFIEVGSESLS
jgi:hypothetical protein